MGTPSGGALLLFYKYNFMIISIIELGLLVGTAFLIRNAKKKKAVGSKVLVLIFGIVTLLFKPTISVAIFDGQLEGGAIEIASTIFGIYFIIWAIVQLIKGKKKTEEKSA